MSDRDRLQRMLGYSFRDATLLQLALTHRSASGNNNERLEFLGDSVVNQVIAEALYQRYPTAREGVLSRMRAILVKGDTLALVAQELCLGEFLVLGAGEQKTGGHRSRSILADTLEAVVGAMLLDSDYEQCTARVQAWFGDRLDALDAQASTKDAKTQLQELLQGNGSPLPQYQVHGVEGKDHQQRFQVTCRVANPALEAVGTGSSRRRAEQAAAQSLLQRITGDEG